MSCGHIIDHHLRESIKEEINPRSKKKKKNLSPQSETKRIGEKHYNWYIKLFFSLKRPTKYVKSSNSDQGKMKRNRNAHFLKS